MRRFDELVSFIRKDFYGMEGLHKDSVHPQYFDTLPPEVFAATWKEPIQFKGFMTGLALSWSRM